MLLTDPFRELDRVFRQVWDGFGRPAAMPVDAFRDGDHFKVVADLPGLDPEALDVTVEHNALSISARRSWQPEEGTEVLVAERPQGTWHRELYLGEGLDTEHVEAHYDRGVLTVTLPVAEQAKPRRVEISSAEAREIGSGHAA